MFKGREILSYIWVNQEKYQFDEGNNTLDIFQYSIDYLLSSRGRFSSSRFALLRMSLYGYLVPYSLLIDVLYKNIFSSTNWKELNYNFSNTSKQDSYYSVLQWISMQYTYISRLSHQIFYFHQISSIVPLSFELTEKPTTQARILSKTQFHAFVFQ